MKPLSDKADDFLVNSRSASVDEENYRAFLLRLWRGDRDQPWHASLIPVGAEERVTHFADLEKLLAFLQAVGC